MAQVAALIGQLARQRQRIFRISTTLVVNVAVLAANMATGIITARGLDPTGRGDLLAISMWPQIIASASTFGMPAALVYELQRKISPPGAIFAGASFVILSSAAVAAALAALIVPSFMASRSAELIAFAQAFLLLTPVISLGLVSISLFQGLEEFRTYNALRMFTPLAVIGCLLSVQATIGLTPQSAALSYAVAGLVATTSGLILALPRLRASAAKIGAGFRGAVRRLLGYGRRHAWADFMGAIESNLDKIILAALLPANQLGLYAVAYGSSRAMLAAASAIAAVEFPRAAGLVQRDALRSMSRGAMLTALVAAVPLLIGVVFAQPLLWIVYGANFEQAATLLRLFLLEGYLLGIVFVLVHAFLAAGLPGVTSKVQAAGTVLSALAVLGGVWIAGALGAAIGMVAVATLKIAVLTTLLFRAISRGPGPDAGRAR